MRAEAYNMMNKFSEAILDFSHILEVDPKNAKVYYRRGLDFIALENKKDGCADLKVAGDMGYFDAYEAINKYCKVEKKPRSKRRIRKK